MKAPYATLELLIDLQKELMNIRDNLQDTDSHIRTRLKEGTDALDALIEEVDAQASYIEVTDYPDTPHRKTLLDTPSPPSV